MVLIGFARRRDPDDRRAHRHPAHHPRCRGLVEQAQMHRAAGTLTPEALERMTFRASRLIVEHVSPDLLAEEKR